MNGLQTIRSAAAVGAEIRALTQQFKYMTLIYGVEVGRRLCEAKELVAHGEWGDWLKAETEFSQSTATRFMRLHQEYGALLEDGDSNSSTLKKVSISNALRLLALPESEREEFAETHDIEHKSARELDKLLAERDAAIKAAEEADALRQRAEDQAINAAVKADEFRIEAEAARAREKDGKIDLESAERKIAELQKENKELRERPIEVAVQVDEEAVKKAAEEAKATADAEWGKKLSKVEKAAEKQVKELEGKAAEADKLRDQLAEEEKRRAGVVAPYEEQIAELKKQLAMSDAAVSRFRVHFDAVQQSWGNANKEVAAMEPEMAEKMRGAMKALLKALEAQI